jgi:ADP-ribose pyrophosphatase YjhB (NUDIX family)
MTFRPQLSISPMPSSRLLISALQRYWRLSRGLTLGAQGAVIAPDGRVLLIRHTYRPGWHFPGGGVEKGETVETALRRELLEEASVEISDAPEVFGIYSNFVQFPGDHVVLFVVRAWRQVATPQTTREIAEHGFFDPDAPPESIAEPARRRLREIFEGVAKSPYW